MTISGKLDRRVQFSRYTSAEGDFGQVETWANHGSPVWAQKTDVSDGERARAHEVSATIMTRWLVRSSSFTRGLTPKDALVYGGVTYEIFGIKEKGRNGFLEITTGAEVSNGNNG